MSAIGSALPNAVEPLLRIVEAVRGKASKVAEPSATAISRMFMVSAMGEPCQS
jgi:hypothetical protein